MDNKEEEFLSDFQFDGDNETISKLRYKIIKALESRSEIEKITIFDIKRSKIDSKCSDI